MKKYFLLVVLFLMACNTNGAILYQENLEKWIGMPEPALYDSWGQPNSVWNIDPQTKVVTYITSQNLPINGDTDPYNGVGIDENGFFQEDFGENLWDDQNAMYYCRTSFTITNGVVVSYNFNGDDCIMPVKF